MLVRILITVLLLLATTVNGDPTDTGTAIGQVAGTYALALGAYAALKKSGFDSNTARIVSAVIVFPIAVSYSNVARAGIGVTLFVPFSFVINTDDAAFPP
jgi:hypothetical protein